MKIKCPNCRLVNFADALICARCEAELAVAETYDDTPKEPGLLRRTVICVCVCVAVLMGFYLSLIVSSRSLTVEQKNEVRSAIALLKDKGFGDEALLLDKFTVFRSDDNWLNASVAKENAYAATNFPFEIVTLYSDFFTYPDDDTERAAILLHEAQHLRGAKEKQAYEYVWKNRQRLGWTKDIYAKSTVWQNIRKQTRDNAPGMFVCHGTEFGDCTE